MIEKRTIVRDSLTGASKAGAVGAAGSILSGVAMASVPIKILGFITVGASAVVSLPVVVAVGAGCAVVGGAAAGYASYRRQRQVETQFQRLIESAGAPDGNPPATGEPAGSRVPDGK